MTLWKQALRSIWRGKKSYFACIVLLAVGVATYVAFQLLFQNLSAAMNGMYRDQRFGDGFATVRGMPRSHLGRVAGIEGIGQVDATVVADARMLKEGSDRVVTLRISSFDPAQQERLNDFLLLDGALPGEGGILVGETFAAANGLAVGDTVPLALKGKRINPVVSGIVYSPEYVYAIPDGGQLFPDSEAFGFAYLPQNRLEALTGLGGSATNLSIALEDGVSFEQVKYQLEDALKPYGLLSLTARKDQPSHAMLEQEVGSIGSMSGSVPIMFIFMAAIILYIMMKRMIEQERSQIGAMKAFGLTDGAVLRHYLSYGLVVGVAGGLLGLAGGVAMTEGMTGLYLDYFSLPAMRMPPEPRYLLGGLLLALLGGVAGALMGARGILRLSPSAAMRPAAPPGVKRDLIGRIPPLRAVLSPLGYMAARNIARNKFRSAFTVAGVAFAFALTAFMASYGEMFDLLMLNQFTHVETYTMKISLGEPAAYTAALEAAASLAGVRRAEALVEIPAELRSGNLVKTTLLVGVQADSDLYHIYDNEGRFTLPPPRGGTILSSSLAMDLRVKRGDVLTVKTPYTGDRELALPVLGVVSTNLGSTAYLEQESLWALLDCGPAATSLILDTSDPAAVKQQLLEAENVSAIADQDEMKRMYVNLLSSYDSMILMMQAAGAVIAFAIITNTASISLSERKREYATMRVMGMHPGEIGRVVGFEYWVLTLAAIPPGIALTRLLKIAMAGMIDTDLFSMPLYTAPSSYAAAAVLCLAAVALSNRSARRKISRFDMVEVLKERE